MTPSTGLPPSRTSSRCSFSNQIGAHSQCQRRHSDGEQLYGRYIQHVTRRHRRLSAKDDGDDMSLGFLLFADPLHHRGVSWSWRHTGTAHALQSRIIRIILSELTKSD